MKPLLAALTLSVLAPPSLRSATWTGAGGTSSWDDPANWEAGWRPVAGETVRVAPLAGVTRVEIGGVDGGTVGGLEIMGAGDLDLVLLEGAGIGSVRSLGTTNLRFEGAGLARESAWDVGAGGSVSWTALPEWSELTWLGEGELRLGQAATPQPVPAQLTMRAGSVHLHGHQLGGLGMLSVVLDGGGMSFDDSVSWLGQLTYRSGAMGEMSVGAVWVDGFRLEAAGDIDLRSLAAITANESRLRAGGTIAGGAVLAGTIVVLEAGVLDLSGGQLQTWLGVEGGRVQGGVIGSEAWMSGGELAATVAGSLMVADAAVAMDGAVVQGSLRLSGATVAGAARIEGELVVEAANPSAWTGQVVLADGATLRWIPAETEAATLSLDGDWTAEGAVSLAIAEADWASPYWESVRSIRLADLWEGSSLAATLTLTEANKEGFGAWDLADGGSDNLTLRWTPELAAIPEASASTLAAAAFLAALSARRRRARPR